jgi:flagellar L-ring protein precursor FlgH
MMMKRSGSLAVLAALAALAAPARADSLYVAAPPPAAPGHPMRLGADHRATQIGDLVQIVFNFNGSANNSDTATTTNSYTAGATPATGLFNLPLLRLGYGLGANTGTSLSKTQAIVQTFTSSMTATVTGVLPSGALVIAGDQKLTINGIPQSLHVTGTIRQEDIDATDSILSSRVANIDAKFSGIDTQEHNKGILQKIVSFLFG